MKIKISTCLICLLVFCLFYSCENDPTNYQFVSDDGRVIATVHGIVQNANTNERLANVTVNYVENGTIKSTTTDSSGYYTISGLTSGSYVLIFSGSDLYTITKETIYIPSIDEIRGEFPSEKDYKYSVTNNAVLYKKNAGFTGKLYAEDANGDLNISAGVTIIADFNNYRNANEIEPSVFSTTTNEEGVFIFDKNLPALYVNIYSLPFEIDGVNYVLSSLSDEVKLIPAVNQKVDDLVANVLSDEAKILSSPFNENDFPVDENISIVFSKSMNANSIDIELQDINTGDKFYCISSWSENNTILSIDPYDTLDAGVTYRLTLEGEAEDKSPFFEYGHFSTIDIDEAIMYENPYGDDDFPVDANIVLKFSKSMIPSQFEIELRRDNAYGHELFFTTTWSNNNTSLTIDPYLILRSGYVYYLKLRGMDSDGGNFYASGNFTTESAYEEDPIQMIRTNLEIIDGEYTDEFPVDGNIELEFNVAVDTSQSYSISLRNNSTYNYVDFILNLSSNEQLMTINPIDSLDYSTEYRLQYQLYDYNGNYVVENIYFYTVEE